ncbi:hypothetical protein ACFYTF_16430 [Nocardia thailandica]|uniref:Secreted protein n=1 Tax=Nocardia thailandica TaxID=257275 RepID=A0ABW6PPS9_9NOCA
MRHVVIGGLAAGAVVALLGGGAAGAAPGLPLEPAAVAGSGSGDLGVSNSAAGLPAVLAPLLNSTGSAALSDALFEWGGMGCITCTGWGWRGSS